MVYNGIIVVYNGITVVYYGTAVVYNGITVVYNGIIVIYGIIDNTMTGLLARHSHNTHNKYYPPAMTSLVTWDTSPTMFL